LDGREDLGKVMYTDFWHKIPYTFSGKEKDSETGYSYFGARYYDSDLSVWLSVDPMATIYPMLSPYTYVANNPIMFYDPDGKIIALVVTSMANKPGAGRYGHMAIIVGNDDIGYHIFSLEDPSSLEKYVKLSEKIYEGKVAWPESYSSAQYVYYSHSEVSLEALLEYIANNAPGVFNKGKNKGNGYDRILALNNVSAEQESEFLKYLLSRSEDDGFVYEFTSNNCSSFSMNMINQFFGNIINDKTAVDIPNREFDKISRDTKNWTVIKDAKQPQMPSNIELPKEKLILGSEGYGN